MHPSSPLALLLVLLAPAPALAATVQRSPGGRIDEQPVDRIDVRARPGEANAMTITVTRSGADRQGSPTVVTVRDDGALLTARRGCRALGGHVVRCRASDEVGEIEALLGDGNDTFALRSVSADQFWFHTLLRGGLGDDVLSAGDGGDLSGGPGDDRLTGSAQYESMDGGPGDDELSGGGHGDYLDGGPGDDLLRGGTSNDDLIGGGGADRLLGQAGDDDLDDGDSDAAQIGADVADGGAGDDSVDSYLRRTAGVTIDLAGATPAGEPGEGDVLVGIERAFGGEGNDVLIGTAARNWLDGRDGDDMVDGAGGNDLLFADGRDSVAGGEGDDDIRTVSALTGPLSCGPGQDVVRLDVFLRADPDVAGPVIEPACELLSSGNGFWIEPVPVAADGRLWFTVRRLRDSPRLSVTAPSDPFASFGQKTVAGDRVGVRVPDGLAGTLRATVTGLGDGAFAWRFALSRR